MSEQIKDILDLISAQLEQVARTGTNLARRLDTLEPQVQGLHTRDEELQDQITTLKLHVEDL